MIKYGGGFEADKKIERVKYINDLLNDPAIWSDSSVDTSELISEINKLNDVVKPLKKLKDNIELLAQYEDLGEEQLDSDLKSEFSNLLIDSNDLLETVETLTYLGGKFDNNGVIFEIHAGAGGTESCDWAMMLSRMYSKYFERKGYSFEVIDEQPGEEAGIKSIVYLVKGDYAYGYLKNEKGVHRLVRLSPFDSNNRRHTSFAAVDVTPEFEQNNEVEIKESDIRIDVYRSSGAGGQGVNTTDSAVRVTHLKTGIVVTCQNERSQIKNKETALKVLKSKLYQLKLKEQKEKLDKAKGSHSGIEFGSQIRSYVLHPYSMIKDHRTNYETSNVNKILDGNLDEFIESNLRSGNANEDF